MAESDRRYDINLGIPDAPNGLPDKEFALVAPIYRALAGLAPTLATKLGLVTYSKAYYPSVQLASTFISGKFNYGYFQLSETVVRGDPLNFWDDAGTIKARKAAAADATKPCVALCDEDGGGVAGDYIKCVFAAAHIALDTGTVGMLYLAPAGGLTNVRPSAAGQIIQTVGYALGARGIVFNPSYQFQQL